MGEGEKRTGTGTGENSSYAYYGTFQGVANYYNPPPPPQPSPVIAVGSPRSSTPFYHGYQTLPVTVYAIEREHPLPCCGLGLGWFFFIAGFFFGGIPWYIGTFILLVGWRDHREKPGYIACAIALVLACLVPCFPSSRVRNVKGFLPS
ncbi:hypothetical protein ACFE04_030438 [Oxalis oulophora]